MNITVFVESLLIECLTVDSVKMLCWSLAKSKGLIFKVRTDDVIVKGKPEQLYYFIFLLSNYINEIKVF